MYRVIMSNFNVTASAKLYKYLIIPKYNSAQIMRGFS